MNETHMAEILDLQRQKLAIQHAATEVVMDDKIRSSEKRIVTAVTGAITNAVLELKSELRDLRAELKHDIASVRDELKGDIADVRTELKTDIARLERKLDCHAH
ncbi:hypothetical protein AB0C18_02510 [Nonomuraea muscovyensis]|uniref:hypothetical protein n=1 Tax=Nonomuraea muscovyensis TaxID=1124761 RepID=UPI0034075105